MKKKMIILLQMIIAIVLIGTSVYAAVTATLDLKVSSNTVKKGDTVSVTLTLKDVDSEKKVGSVSGYINYDKEVIERLTVDSIVKNENNTVTIGSETLTVEDLTNRPINQIVDSKAYIGFNGDPSSNNDSRIVIDFNGAIEENTDLVTINFKVKETASIGEVENAIQYKMFVITSGTGETSQEISKNVTLTITDVNTEDGDNQNQTNSGNETNNNTVENEVKNNTVNNNTVNNETTNNTSRNETRNSIKNNTTTNKVNNTNTNTAGNKGNTKDNTIASIILPATGARGVIIPAIILILCAYICYNRYMKYKDI